MRGRAAPPHPGIYRVPPHRDFVLVLSVVSNIFSLCRQSVNSIHTLDEYYSNNSFAFLVSKIRLSSLFPKAEIAINKWFDLEEVKRIYLNGN